MKRLLLIPIVPFLLYGAEPSAFSAGNLDSNNPYGLTPREKKILENKKKVRNLTNKFGGVDAKLRDTLTSVEGIQGEVEQNSMRTFSLERKISKIENLLGIGKPTLNDSNTSQNQSIITVSNKVATLDSSKKFSIAQRLDKIEEYIRKSRTLQKQNYTKINSSLLKVARLTDSKPSKQEVKKMIRAEIKKYLDKMFKK